MGLEPPLAGAQRGFCQRQRRATGAPLAGAQVRSEARPVKSICQADFVRATKHILPIRLM
jgi:hypothetical protein